MPQRFFNINPFDKRYREGLVNFRVQPRRQMWHRISHALDQQETRSIGMKRMFLVLSIITVAAVVITAILIPESTQTITKKRIKNTLVTAAPAIINSVPISGQVITQNTDVTPSLHQLSILNNNLKNTVKYLDEILNQVSKSEKAEMKKIAQRPFSELNSDSGMKEIYMRKKQTRQMPSLSKSKHSEKSVMQSVKFPGTNNFCIRGFYAGASTAINFTKLIDEKAKNNDNFHYFFTTGTAYTIKAGYNFSERVGVEAGWNIKSTEGQKYNFIPYSVARIDVDQMKNRITLNYTQIPVTVKYKFTKVSSVTKHPLSLNVEAGVQYGYLKSVTKSYQNSLTQDDKFRKHEIAAVAGVGYDVYLSKNIAVNLGARATYGTNIFQSPVSEYNEFSAPHNLTAGVHAGLTYLFPGCK